MEITYEEDYLRELCYEGKAHNKKLKFPTFTNTFKCLIIS